MAMSECSDVLKDGTRAISLYSSRFEYRRLLESRLVNMTYQEAKSDTSLTGTIPIGDIILGVGFDQKSFDSYKSYLQKDTSLRVDVSRSLDIMLSTGDPEILKAWSACMQTKNGLSLFFSEVHAKSAVLNLKWWPAVGVPQVWVTQDFKLPNGVVVVSGNDILEGKKAIVAGTDHQVKFEFDKATTTFPLTLNVKGADGLAGADSAYLPARLEAYRESRPYQFEAGLCDKNATFGVDTRHHTGNSNTQKYCTDSANGWRFSKGSLVVTARVAIPGQIPLTFANYQALWSGDDQVTVVLGCSNSSGTDIQCQATCSVEEERWLWKERVD